MRLAEVGMLCLGLGAREASGVSVHRALVLTALICGK